MDPKRAYLIAINAMKKEKKQYAFEANLYRLKLAEYPHAEKSAKKYADLCQAIQILERISSG